MLRTRSPRGFASLLLLGLGACNGDDVRSPNDQACGAVGQPCADAASMCDGGDCAPCTGCAPDLCSRDSCAAPVPTCTDGTTNGMETDVDCGGGACAGCGGGLKCRAPADCASGVCCDQRCSDAPACGGCKGTLVTAQRGHCCNDPTPVDVDFGKVIDFSAITVGVQVGPPGYRIQAVISISDGGPWRVLGSYYPFCPDPCPAMTHVFELCASARYVRAQVGPNADPGVIDSFSAAAQQVDSTPKPLASALQTGRK